MDQLELLIAERIVSFIPNPLEMEGARHVFDHALPRLAQVINARVLIAKAIHDNKLAQENKKQLLLEDRLCTQYAEYFTTDKPDLVSIQTAVKTAVRQAGFFSGITRQMSMNKFICVMNDILDFTGYEKHIRNILIKELQEADM